MCSKEISPPLFVWFSTNGLLNIELYKFQFGVSMGIQGRFSYVAVCIRNPIQCYHLKAHSADLSLQIYKTLYFNYKLNVHTNKL